MANPVTADLAELREFDPTDSHVEDFYCSRCACNKSGDVAEPNGRGEACGEYDCPCHTGLVTISRSAPSSVPCERCGAPTRDRVHHETGGVEYVDRWCPTCDHVDIDPTGGI